MQIYMRTMNTNKKTWIILVIVTMFSWAGINKIIHISKDYSAYSSAIADVPSIVNQSSNINNFSNLDALKSSQTKIQNTIKKLKEIPNFPGYPYQNAQNKIHLLDQLLVKNDSKVKDEEEAFNNLKTAQNLDNEASLLVKDKTYSNNWKKAKNKWQQAIDLLQKISADSYVSNTAKQGILTIKRNLDDIDKVITSEDKSIQQFSTAVQLAQKTITLTQDTTNITSSNLSIAKSQWQQAINLLTSVPSTSVIFSKAQSELTVYRNNYKEVSKSVDCMSQYSWSDYTCTYNLSDISKPGNLTALLQDVNEQDTNNTPATPSPKAYIYLSEEERKNLYQEEVLFQDKTSKESEKLYSVSPDVSDSINSSNIKSQQEYNYQKEKEWRIAHNLTYDQNIKLDDEGYKKGWTPPYSN